MHQEVGRAVWAAILGVGTMALIQAMAFSFVQQIGTDRGFGIQAVTGVLEGTGRALAATPAMLMIGSATGPILGGSLVKSFGYSAIGIAACVFALVAVGLFSQARVREVAVVRAAA